MLLLRIESEMFHLLLFSPIRHHLHHSTLQYLHHHQPDSHSPFHHFHSITSPLPHSHQGHHP
jgi:predicted nicotinamide N-methyase